jgi:hypothetical protein
MAIYYQWRASVVRLYVRYGYQKSGVPRGTFFLAVEGSTRNSAVDVAGRALLDRG